VGVILAIALLQQTSPCGVDATALVTRAAALAEELDLSGAARLYADAARIGCDAAARAAVYVGGLQAARDAYGAGGADWSLEKVRTAIAALETRARSGDRTAEIARVTLLAAAAAAQSERDDMATFLAQATYLERLQHAASPGAMLPATAHEVAGDLWLQVHRFDTAQEAYRAAADLVGMTPRIAAGLARTAVRLKEAAAACAAYRTLLEIWKDRSSQPAEVGEARTYVRVQNCAP
jgi:tetratricopeptide (TPR) repeat protein